MNWHRAAYAAGAGVAALLSIFSAIAIVFAATFDLASAFTFGGGSSEGKQVLWVVVPPAAVGFGSALIALALGAGWRRLLMCAGGAFVAAVYISLKEIVPYNPLLDYEARFIVFVFLLIAALSVLIATVRRADISPLRTGIIAVFVIISVVVGTAGPIAVSAPVVEVSVSIAVAAWIVLPALAALLVPPSSDETRISEESE